MSQMRPRHIFSLVLIVISLSGLSCEWLSTRNHNVDSTSPNGTYRVKVEAQVEDEGYGSFSEQVKVQFFKGPEIVQARAWQRKDTFESTFIDDNSVVEWLNDNVVRMGRERTNQPFMDVVTVSNNSGEHLKYVRVWYARLDSFMVFDVVPGNSITIQASPEFQPGSPSMNDYVTYSGTTQSGRNFDGIIKNEQRKTPADGQLKFQVTISPKDLTVATTDER